MCAMRCDLIHLKKGFPTQFNIKHINHIKRQQQRKQNHINNIRTTATTSIATIQRQTCHNTELHSFYASSKLHSRVTLCMFLRKSFKANQYQIKYSVSVSKSNLVQFIDRSSIDDRLWQVGKCGAFLRQILFFSLLYILFFVLMRCSPFYIKMEVAGA